MATLERCAIALRTVHALRGDDAAEPEWAAIADALGSGDAAPSGKRSHHVLDAVRHLHTGHPAAARIALDDRPTHVSSWDEGAWLQWHAALLAEAAVLDGSADAADLVADGRGRVTENPVAAAIVDRAAALLAGDTAGVLDTARRFATAGGRYQHARSLLLAGDPAAAAMAALEH